MAETQERAAALVPAVCPNGLATVGITLNPAYLAKSFSPGAMIDKLNGHIVGSRGRKVSPQSTGKEETCPELIVAAPVARLRSFSSIVDDIDPDSTAADDFRKIEDLRIESATDRVSRQADERSHVWELVVHAGSVDDEALAHLLSFAESTRGGESAVDRTRYFFAGGLCFLPVVGTVSQITALAEHTFVRHIRVAPRIRSTRITIGGPDTIDCKLPTEAAMDTAKRLLVIDGGRTPIDHVSQYVRDYEYPELGPPDAEYQDHGAGVVSAALFGSCTPEVRRPFCMVDSIRVFDDRTGVNSDFEYFDVLERIRNVLHDYGDTYDFACLCSGPDIAITDGEPSAWTAVLDQVCGRIRTELFCAAGNGGHLDAEAGLNRVQPPSDGCNIIAVGASTGTGGEWRRSSYSSVGRGRMPGYVKPDFVVNGGELPNDPFYVVGPAFGTAIPKQGTSLAAPNAARIAASIRASLGDQISPLGVKALMINRSDPGDNRQIDVGWGKVGSSTGDLISTGDDEVVVVYEGKLAPGQWRAIPLPLPEVEIPGQVEISATFCFKTETDPHHPLNYTRAGLEIIFRPHAERFEEDENGKRSKRPKRGDFFTAKQMYNPEISLRREASKWESVMHRTKKPYGSSLLRPVFDVLYTTRKESKRNLEPKPIPYVLVLRLRAKHVKELYNLVVQHHQNVLIPMRSVIQLPIRGF